MRLTGPVALGYMWCRIVAATMGGFAQGGAVEPTRDELVIGSFLVERMLPETPLHPARIRADAGNVTKLPAGAF